jgi:tetratricopeptide (TPR) repeat protein
MTQPPDPRAAFAAAERAYVEGRFASAREALATIAQLGHPAVHHLRAIVEQKLGNLTTARSQFEAATLLAPQDPHIWNNFGNFLRRLGDEPAALEAYERALALSERFGDATFNRANLLLRLGRREEARIAFLALIDLEPEKARAWNGLAAVHKASGDLESAASAYDSALAVTANDRLATVGRARIALERQEPDVVERYRAARRMAPDDRELALDEIEARLGQGDRAALDELAGLTRSAPDWTHGQITLARLRWEQGERAGFADHVEALLAIDSAQPGLWAAYVQLLGECGQSALAADVAQRARRVLADDGALQLAEAVQAGRAGQISRAETLFATLPSACPGRAIHEAVHRIRRGELDRAICLAEAAIEEAHWDLAAWGILELLCRKTGDRRGEWLSGQPGLVSVSQLPLDPADFRAADSLLSHLHRDTVEATGQSVRGGTQTRWNLFDRIEPELARLRDAIDRALADHLANLPARDDAHPLLRHRSRRMRIGPSWSVRFLDAGHHVPHFHPKGLISSACYIRVPPPHGAPHEGWLEIGRPPADLLLDLEPIQLIKPEPGKLILFPSYLYHGTRPFSAGERLSVAFDVVAAGLDA